jgi:hypothetical protein
MHGNIEEMLTRELRQIADRVEVPPLPPLPAGLPSRLVWRPLSAAAAVVLIVLVTSVSLLRGDGGTPQPAPQPTDWVIDSATPSPSPEGAPDVTPSIARNRADRAEAGLDSWSPALPEGEDGEPRELGNIVLGGVEPVEVGAQVADYVRRGYLVADPNPPCGGNRWLWAGQLSEGLYVSASQEGTIMALGTDKDGLETADGIGVGNTLRALKATYGEFLAQVRTDDQGLGWVFVKQGDRWLAFSLGPADQVTDASRVDFIEVGRGDVLHHFSDAC